MVTSGYGCGPAAAGPACLTVRRLPQKLIRSYILAGPVHTVTSEEAQKLSSEIGRRFHRPPAPSVIACLGSHDPIVFSHLVSDEPTPEPTIAPPVEDVFAVHVHHAELRLMEIWIAGRHTRFRIVQRGGVFIYDLRTQPQAHVYERYEFSRFQISRATMDDLAYEQGIRRLDDLRASPGEQDPVLRHLVLALTRHAELFGPEQDTLFNDGVALAFFAHIARKYAGIREPAQTGAKLAPWQVRRLSDWVGTHMQCPITIADLAGLVNLSRSHFSRMFQKSLGISAHQWLLLRRIERARQLLKGTASLAEISVSCGFVDQSHFTKVFTRVEGLTPGSWRRHSGT
jgi:AraC-like DNA-binding protein